MLTEKAIYLPMQDTEAGHIGVKRVDQVLRDGVVIAETLHRHVLAPGADISNEPENVQAVCRAVWTDEALQAWADFQAAQQGL